nr:hypothetical protein [Tanacetum cinerariifolium]
MATMAENVIVAGAENRPSMLEKGMYDSWKSHILFHIEGMENDEMLIDSINNGYQLTYTLLSIITRQPKTYGIGVKELMEGTELTIQERDSKLYDDFDRFTSEKGNRFTRII